MRKKAMTRALIVGAAAVALLGTSASADGYRYRHHYGYHYGYAGPVFDYTGNAYYGFPPHAYQHTPWPIYGGGYGDSYGRGWF
jgi:hypothetical protein